MAPNISQYFLVACTRLYSSLCRSVCLSVGLSGITSFFIAFSVLFKPKSYYCPTARDSSAVYLALLYFSKESENTRESEENRRWRVLKLVCRPVRPCIHKRHEVLNRTEKIGCRQARHEVRLFCWLSLIMTHRH